MIHMFTIICLTFAFSNRSNLLLAGMHGDTDEYEANDESSAKQIRVAWNMTGSYEVSKAAVTSSFMASADKSMKKKRLHILSMGRGGSCFLGGVMSIGRPYIFEPFNVGRGMWNTPMGEIKTPLHCMYDCSECEHVLRPQIGSGRSLQDFCQSEKRTRDKVMVIKTVNLDDYGALLSLNKAELAETMFVHLVRDPRAITNSNRCMREYLQALSAKDFLIRSKIPSEQFVTLFYEQWAQNVEGVVKDLHGKLDWPESPAIIKKAVSDHKSSISKWTGNAANFGRERGLFCAEMMSFFGYIKGSSNYSSLTDRQLHNGALTGTEEQHLAHLRTKCKPCCDCPPSIHTLRSNASGDTDSGIQNVSTSYDDDYDPVFYKTEEGHLNETDFNLANLEDDQDSGDGQIEEGRNIGLKYPDSGVRDENIGMTDRTAFASQTAHVASDADSVVDPCDTFPAPGSKFEIPSGKTAVEINIGTNWSPIKASGPHVYLILVEPSPSIAPVLKKREPTATVLQMAISNFTGTALFHNYQSNSQASSSLSDPTRDKFWSKNGHDIQVNVHTLKELLDAVPKDVPIQFLKTDMQGHDLTAIKSAGSEITRISKVLSEAYVNGKEPNYKGVTNDRESFETYMKKMGFRESSCSKVNDLEMDCEFVHVSSSFAERERRRQSQLVDAAFLDEQAAKMDEQEGTSFRPRSVEGSVFEAKGDSEIARERYSQAGQDKWAMKRQSNDQTIPKTFLDIGARDGIFFSNSQLLEENGWIGACVEPAAPIASFSKRKCKFIRKAVVGKHETNREFRDCYEGTAHRPPGGHSGFGDNMKRTQKGETEACKKIAVEQVTPAELLVETDLPSVIGYISLDVEGNELEVITAFPWDKACARLWTIEADGNGDQVERVRATLQSHGCIEDKDIGLNHLDAHFACECGSL